VTVTTAPSRAETAPASTATASAPRRAAPARPAVRTPVRAAVRAAPVAVAPAPAPAATGTAPAPAATVATPSLAPAAPIQPAPPPEAITTTTDTPVTQETRRGPTIWPWLLIGALLVAGAILFARRRRRTAVYDEVYEREPEVVAAPAAVAAAPVVAERGEPEIELGMEPVRAGVAGEDARVEFRLTVGNRGSAPAEGVRVSTWMLAAGSSDMERMLIEPRAETADTPAVTIAAGESRTMEAAVALPTSEVEGDAVLPVVVADASWRSADGGERHTRISYAVGVPDGEELMHFDTEHPSGLHEGVVAHALGEPERA
jgi:hypothetical protein